MFSYEDRNRDRFNRNLLVGGALGAGLFGLYHAPNLRQSAGRMIAGGLHTLASKIETSLFRGALTNIRAGALSSEEFLERARTAVISLAREL